MTKYRILVEFEVEANDEDTAMNALNAKLTYQTVEESSTNYDIVDAE